MLGEGGLGWGGESRFIHAARFRPRVSTGRVEAVSPRGGV